MKLGEGQVGEKKLVGGSMRGITEGNGSECAHSGIYVYDTVKIEKNRNQILHINYISKIIKLQVTEIIWP